MLKRSLLIILLVIPGFLFQANAQKIGHINSVELLSYMPEVAVADKKLEEVAAKLEKQNNALYDEYNMKVKEYQNATGLTESAKKDLEAVIQNIQERIQNFQTSAQEELAQKKEEFYSPILDRADAAIKAVAKENGYTYILDTSMGSVLYADDSKEIMSLVKTKLGL